MEGITAEEIICRTSTLPVFCVTANSDLNTLDQAMKTKPFGSLTNPVSERGLQSATETATENLCSLFP